MLGTAPDRIVRKLCGVGLDTNTQFTESKRPDTVEHSILKLPDVLSCA